MWLNLIDSWQWEWFGLWWRAKPVKSNSQIIAKISFRDHCVIARYSGWKNKKAILQKGLSSIVVIQLLIKPGQHILYRWGLSMGVRTYCESAIKPLWKLGVGPRLRTNSIQYNVTSMSALKSCLTWWKLTWIKMLRGWLQIECRTHWNSYSKGKSMAPYIHFYLTLLSVICLATRTVLTVWCRTINEAYCVAWTFAKGLWGMINKINITLDYACNSSKGYCRPLEFYGRLNKWKPK